MLDRLQHHALSFDEYTELRWHTNHALRLVMRKGALLQNSQSREGGVSARCHRSGAFGFASRPGDTDDAIETALGAARDNAALYERTVGRSSVSLPQTQPRAPPPSSCADRRRVRHQRHRAAPSARH
jgi:predicted Zn-dependent protease